MPAVAKVCTLCGDDVSAKKRLKDPQGRYFCEPCAKKQPNAQVKKKAPAAPEPISAPLDLADPPAPHAAPTDDGLLDLAPEVKPKSDEPMFGCAGCKKLVPQRQVRNIDGEFLCSACVGKRNAPARPTASKVRPAVARPEDDENPERWTDTFTGGLVVSGILLVVLFGLFTGINLAMPDKLFGSGVARSLAFGLFSTVRIGVAAVALLLSMLLTSKIMGGISFGTIGTAFYKAIGMCAGILLFDHFSAHNETLGMINLGFGGGVYVLGFIFLFGLDFMEAVVLTCINWVLGFLLNIAALAVAALIFVGAVGAMGGGMDQDDWDNDQEMVQPGAKDPAKNNARDGAEDEDEKPAQPQMQNAEPAPAAEPQPAG